MAQIYISLGSNIEREFHIKHGIASIAKAFDLPLNSMQLSSLFESEAIGFDSDNFYNMVVGLECNLSVEEVATLLKKIEIAHGRTQQAKKYSPRTLDLDLLLYDDLIIEKPAQLPREEICYNAFVLWPLSELAPKRLHPILQLSYQELWQNYDKSSQQLHIVANCW